MFGFHQARKDRVTPSELVPVAEPVPEPEPTLDPEPVPEIVGAEPVIAEAQRFEVFPRLKPARKRDPLYASVDQRAVRAWCKEQGIPVNQRGSLPKALLERYLAAQEAGRSKWRVQTCRREEYPDCARGQSHALVWQGETLMTAEPLTIAAAWAWISAWVARS
jgi:hypothetical protein